MHGFFGFAGRFAAALEDLVFEGDDPDRRVARRADLATVKVSTAGFGSATASAGSSIAASAIAPTATEMRADRARGTTRAVGMAEQFWAPR